MSTDRIERAIEEAVNGMHRDVGNALGDLASEIDRSLDRFQHAIAEAIETALGLGGDDTDGKEDRIMLVRADELVAGDTIVLDGKHATITAINTYNLAVGDRVVATSYTEDGNRWPVLHITPYGLAGIGRFPHEMVHRVKEYAHHG